MPNGLVAAVPQRASGPFAEASVGQRFQLFLKFWEPNTWSPTRDGKREALSEVGRLPQTQAKLLEALLLRHAGASSRGGDAALVREARATSPFVTGTGSPHPSENGFTFLDPYGLPCLPGSSVKGVVRRAAEELTFFEPQARGWNLLALWWLFGFDASSAVFPDAGRNGQPEPLEREAAEWRRAYVEAAARAVPDDVREFISVALPAKKREEWLGRPKGFLETLADQGPTGKDLRSAIHLRGSACLWDVVPQLPPNEELRVDVISPHHHPYYKNGRAPADCYAPKPVFFLTLPPGTTFRFVVTLAAVPALPDALRKSWSDLITAALTHACEWLGFGAKTAVGYGALEPVTRAAEPEPIVRAGRLGRYSNNIVRYQIDGEARVRKQPLDAQVLPIGLWTALNGNTLREGRRIRVTFLGDVVTRIEPADGPA